ncbi:GH39 family glycosyl hydrolase [Georgenia deserti]|uniref:Glycoside hydrolase n=1 Tax=Georgenia deserti TaxID=2093781 RepID=A0ABW4L4X3_9MICO
MSVGSDVNPGIGIDESPFPKNAPSDPTAPHVRTAHVRVDAGADLGELTRLWESIGYDEFNWTYTPTGRRLLGTFGEMTSTGFHVRPHYVFCSGSGFAIPHWGNGNVYHEGPDGQPAYDFTMVDQAYDAIVEAGHHVLVELAFTPRDLLPEEAAELTVTPSPTVYSNYEAGAWAYPPRDYERWGDLVRAHVRHCRERYGDDEVGTWLWELWNEPDIFYWRGTPQQFYELYSVTAAAVRDAMPAAKVGGPAVTGAGVEFLRGFLQHARDHGDPLDFVSFHTKGSAFTPWRVYGPTGGEAPEQQSPSSTKMLFEVRRMLRVMGEFAEYRDLPAIVDECDAGVPAHYSAYDNANFGFQNTEYYPVFQVKLMKKLLDVNDSEPARVAEATSWSFYFEAERYFEGTRAFLTAGGVEKPLLNGYRALAHLGRTRVGAVSDAAQEIPPLDDTSGASMAEEVDTLAARSDDGAVSVLVWRHTDDQYRSDDVDADVTVSVAGLTGRYRLRHLRIDAEHSNAHTVWKRLGSPQVPSEEELALIRSRQGLEEYEPSRTVTASDGAVDLRVRLPLPSVSLLVLEPLS